MTLAAWWTDSDVKQRHPHVVHGKKIYIAKTAYLDRRAPITLGDKVTICDWVKILTHDYSPVAVLKRKEEVGEVKIGTNVFIGICVIILPNVTIGDNVIVGAGAVVSKNLESNAVYAGNPIVKIKDIVQ